MKILCRDLLTWLLYNIFQAPVIKNQREGQMFHFTREVGKFCRFVGEKKVTLS